MYNRDIGSFARIFQETITKMRLTIMDFYWSRSLCNIICGKCAMLWERCHCVMQVWPWVNEEGRKLVEGVHIIMMPREAWSPVGNLDSKYVIKRVFFVSLQCLVIGQAHPITKAVSELRQLRGTLTNVTSYWSSAGYVFAVTMELCLHEEAGMLWSKR